MSDLLGRIIIRRVVGLEICALQVPLDRPILQPEFAEWESFLRRNVFLGMIVVLKRRSVYFSGLSVGGKQLGCTTWLLRMFITISYGEEVHG